MFCELLWILESQLLVSNKTQGSVHYTRFMSYFHIVNKDRWKIKPIHLKEMHLCLSVALTAFLAWESFNKKLQRKLKSFLFLSLIEVSLLIAATGAPQHYWLCLQSAGKSLSKMATTGRVKNQRYLQMSSSCHSVALSEMSLSRSLEPLLLGQLERILTLLRKKRVMSMDNYFHTTNLYAFPPFMCTVVYCVCQFKDPTSNGTIHAFLAHTHIQVTTNQSRAI